MKSILFCFVTLIGIYSAAQPSRWLNTEPYSFEVLKGPGNPAWQDQYWKMKKDANGNIPRLPFDQIREHELNSFSRSVNLFSIKELGPKNVGGRTRALMIDLINPNRLFAAGVSSGLWV